MLRYFVYTPSEQAGLHIVNVDEKTCMQPCQQHTQARKVPPQQQFVPLTSTAQHEASAARLLAHPPEMHLKMQTPRG